MFGSQLLLGVAICSWWRCAVRSRVCSFTDSLSVIFIPSKMLK